MLNILRADVYRLLHAKGFWVLQAVIVGVVSFCVAVAVNSKMSLTAVSLSQSSTDGTLMFYILPLIIILFGADFANGTLKEIITSGISCTKFFFSKLAGYGVVQFLIIAEAYLLPFLVGLVLGGPGQITGKFAAVVLYQGGFFWVIMFAISVLAYFMLFLTKSSAVAIMTAIVGLFVFLTFHMTDSVGLIIAGVVIVVGVLMNNRYFNQMDL